MPIIVPESERETAAYITVFLPEKVATPLYCIIYSYHFYSNRYVLFIIKEYAPIIGTVRIKFQQEQTMKTRQREISVVASALLAGSILFSGCGGGGSTPAVTAASVTITGKAVDELILNGVVEVHKGSAAGAVIGRGRTDSSNGTYTIDLDGYKGVTVVKVTCDSNSTLYYPDTNKTAACPSDTKLFSAADVKEGNVTVNIAPSTHIMYMMATQGDPNATIDGQKLEEARVAAAQIFGTDPISSDPTEGIYAKVIEAFHKAAEDANRSIQDVVEDIAEDAADGILGDDGNVTDILAQKMQENNVTTPFVEAAENNETFTPEVPDDAGTVDDVQAAKEFFQNLRTQGDNLFKDGGLFDTEAKGMESVVENVTLNGDLAGRILGNLLDAVGEGIDNNLTEVNTNLVTLTNASRDANLTRADLNSSVWNYVITDTVSGASSTVGNGTITLPAADPSKIDPNSFTTLTAAFDGTIPATMLYEANQTRQTLQANAALTKTTDGAHLEVSDINLSTADGTMVGIKGFKADVGYDYNASDQNDSFRLNYVKLNEITLNGALDSNYTASATLKVGYTMNSSLATNGGFTEVYTTEVGGHVGCYNQSDGTYVDYANSTFDVNMSDGSGYLVNTDGNGNFDETIDGKEYYYDDFINASVTFNGTCSNGAVPNIDNMWVDTSSDMKVGNSGYIPDSMTLNGMIKNVQTQTELDGTFGVNLMNAADMNLSDMDHVNDKPHLKVTASGTLKRAGLDDMSLNLQLEYRPDNNMTDATVAYVYGPTTVNAVSHVSDDGDGNVTLTSGNGLSITVVLNDDEIDYNATTPLMKDGKEVGHLDNGTGVPRIKYIDGSFESLP